MLDRRRRALTLDAKADEYEQQIVELYGDHSLDCLLAWGRGLAKSSTMEGSLISAGAQLGAIFCVYISSTQDKATEHLQSIRDTIEGSALAEYYPGLSNPRLGTYGNQRGWKAQAIYTDSGFAVVAASLEKGIRGLRDNERRPLILVFDDIDERDDSPAIKNEKFETLRNDAIGMLAPFGSVLFGQNLIYNGSIMDDTWNGRLDWLYNCHKVGIVNTFKDDLKIEKVNGRPKIIAGTANWSRISKPVGQDMLNKLGEGGFQRECMNRTAPDPEELVWKHYDSSIHVITWDDFQRVFGIRRIPSRWNLYAGYDRGYTGWDSHPSVLSVAAVAGENTKLAGDVFIFYEYYTDPSEGVDDIAKHLFLDLSGLCEHSSWGDAAYLVRQSYEPSVTEQRAKLLRKQAGALVSFDQFNGSHEGKSERDSFNNNWSLPCQAGDSNKTAGLEQLHSRLKPEHRRHPFYPQLLQRPNIYLVVAPEQREKATDRFGLKRHRYEAENLKWDKNITTRDVPTKHGDDATDACFVAGTLVRTDKGEIPIEQIQVGDLVYTRDGLRPVVRSGVTSEAAEVFQLTTKAGLSIVATGNHPILIHRDSGKDKGWQWMPLSKCSKRDKLHVWDNQNLKSSSSTGSSITATLNLQSGRIAIITKPILKVGETVTRLSTSQSGKKLTAKFQRGMKFIIGTATRWITFLKTLNVFPPKSIASTTAGNRELVMTGGLPLFMPHGTRLLSGTGRQQVSNGIGTMRNEMVLLCDQSEFGTVYDAEKNTNLPLFAQNIAAISAANVIELTPNGKSRFLLVPSVGGNSTGSQTESEVAARMMNVCVLGAQQRSPEFASIAAKSIKRVLKIDRGAQGDAVKSIEPAGTAKVYNLTVANTPEYFANGILVHNCKQYLQTFALTPAPLTDDEEIDARVEAVSKPQEEIDGMSEGQRKGYFQRLARERYEIEEQYDNESRSDYQRFIEEGE